MTFAHLLASILFCCFSSTLFPNSAYASDLNDTEPPLGPAYEIATNITQTSVDLEWPQATDNVAVIAYNIYQDNVLLMSTDELTLSITITGLTPGTRYRFSLTSSDAAGNESNRRFGRNITTKPSTCGISNYWVGNSANWGDNPLNWSESAIANECQGVVINNDSLVTIGPFDSYACTTFEVAAGSEFDVKFRGEFHVIPSEPGPYSIMGTYSYQDCIGNGEFSCPFLEVYDNQNCGLLLGGDIVYDGTYVISGDILTVELDVNFGFCTVFRIIDDNNLIRIGTAEFWSK